MNRLAVNASDAMARRVQWIWSIALASGVICASLLQCSPADAQVASGPNAGVQLEALKVVVAAGENAGQEADLAEQRKGKPTLYVFVQADKWDRPIARFVKILDQSLAKDHPGAAVVAVWLTEDVAKSKEYLPRAQQSLQMTQTTWAVYPGSKDGPSGWGINAKAHITVVVAQDQKVTSSMGYLSVNETETPKVLKELKPMAP